MDNITRFWQALATPAAKQEVHFVSPNGLVSPFCVKLGERIFCRKLLHFKPRNSSFWTFDLLDPYLTKKLTKKTGIRRCSSPFPSRASHWPSKNWWMADSIRCGFVSEKTVRHNDAIFENWGGTRCSAMLYGYCCTERWSTGTCVGSKLNLKSKIVENCGRDIFRTWVEKGNHWREEKLHTARLRPSWLKEPTWRPGLRTGCKWIQSAKLWNLATLQDRWRMDARLGRWTLRALLRRSGRGPRHGGDWPGTPHRAAAHRRSHFSGGHEDMGWRWLKWRVFDILRLYYANDL